MLFFYEILGYPFICRLFFMIFRILDLFQLIPHKRLTFPSLTMLQHHMSKILTVHSLLCPIHLHFALFDLPSVTCNITVYSQHNSQPHVWHFTSDSHIHYILHTNFKKRHVQNKSFVLWGSEGYRGIHWLCAVYAQLI